MNTPATTTNILAKITGISFLIIGILVVVNVFLSAQVAQDGLAIDSLSKKQSEIRLEIAMMEQDLVSKTSLADLSNKAADLGFEKPTQVVTVRAANPVALNR